MEKRSTIRNIAERLCAAHNAGRDRGETGEPNGETSCLSVSGVVGFVSEVPRQVKYLTNLTKSVLVSVSQLLSYIGYIIKKGI
jgi:hypothetical protein